MIENFENTFNIFSNNLQSLVNETLETYRSPEQLYAVIWIAD